MSSIQSTQNQKNLVLYFQVHQPKRLNTLRFFDIGTNRPYFDEELNREICQRVARECYLPANDLLLRVIRKHPGIRVAFSVSGVTIDQLEIYAPEVLDSFRNLAETGSVEFLAETYYHSLACMIPGNEFELQVAKHQRKILEHFGVRPNVFRNTELIHSDDIGARIDKLGFEGAFIDGVDRVVESHSPHHVFEHANAGNLKLLARNYRLSDDISFRFAQSSEPLSAGRYISWLEQIPSDENVINVAMDYETFGEHQKAKSGIFAFMEALLTQLSQKTNFRFMTPSEAVKGIPAQHQLRIPGYISWADHERDVSAWLGNEMQRDAFDSLVKLEADVKATKDQSLLRDWRTLQVSDHFYYMSTKNGNDGDVHAYFSPYPSPYEAFINYMNVLTDFGLKVKIRKSIASIIVGDSVEPVWPSTVTVPV